MLHYKLQQIILVLIYSNPLAGLILRMFNLPTGTILINFLFKV